MPSVPSGPARRSNRVNKSTVAKKVVEYAAGGATMWLSLQFILFFGIEKKSIFEIFTEMIGGGMVGAAIGALFFLSLRQLGCLPRSQFVIGIFLDEPPQ